MQKQISLGLGTEYRYFLHALYFFARKTVKVHFRAYIFHNSFSSNTTDLEDSQEDNKNKTESLIDAILTNNDSGHRQVKNM